ncbi:hypothetical protein [Rathayibacter sp. PhB127]|uniref:hypothetical protein n=1 Tax=Rathayibacter sp. PhB127 TaxID=2485176 RepID=UPI00160E1E02|nr:hypothetical protein [Rathayibacter sp. PhB127]
MVEAAGDPWYSDVLTTIVTLAIGAAIGFLPTHYSERRKEKREDKQRWHSETIIRAGKFIDSAEKTILAQRDFESVRLLSNTPPHGGDLANEAASKVLVDNAMKDLKAAGTQLSLVANISIRKNAQDCYLEVQKYISNGTASVQASVDEWQTRRVKIIDPVREMVTVKERGNVWGQHRIR